MSARLRRMSIRTKFHLGLSLWTAGVLLFVGGYYPTRLAREFSSRLAAEASAAATLLAHHLAPAADLEDRHAAAQGIRGALLLKDVEYVGVFARDGRPLAELGRRAGPSPARTDTLSVAADRIVVTRRINGIDGQLAGSLALESSLARLHARRREDLLATAGLGAAILAIGLLIALFLERAVVRPIKRVTAGVERVAAGAGEVRPVLVESDDEAGQLARAFNAMRERLERTTVSRDYLESLLASVADMLFVVDRLGLVRSVNRATRTVLELDEREILGRPLGDFLATDADLLGETRERRLVTDRAATVLRRHGASLPALVSGAMVAGPQATGEVVLLARDITETRRLIAAEARAEEQQRRAAELATAYADLAEAHRQLKEAQAKLVQSGRLAAVGELAAGVAHEMNNPLSAVLTYATLLESKLADLPPEVRDRLDGFGRQLALIGVGATRCKAISDNLLAFSRGSEAPMARVEIADLIERTIELTGAHFRFKRVQLTREVSQGLEVWGVDTALQQVLTNLLVNAAQAVGEGGHVEVRASGDHERVLLEVRDDGPGMPPEVKARIFEPFFTTKPLGKGTGLGLSIVHGIVEKHRGRIEVSSEPGAGASFRVFLPAQSPPPHAESTEGDRRPPG